MSIPVLGITANRTTLVEEQGTVITITFNLSTPPPSTGILASVDSVTPRALSELLVFGATYSGARFVSANSDSSGFTVRLTAQTATISLPVYDDSTFEGTESFTYTLQPSSSYTINPSASAITFSITDSDPLLGTEGNDSLTGTTSNDIIDGLGGDDRLIGDTGNDTLSGGAGNDNLYGGTGNDSLIGGGGNDSYFIDSSGDVISENTNSGIDTVNSNISYTLLNNLENLTLLGTSALTGTGNSANNLITGNGANNALYGLEGNDTLIGSAGNDTLIGGAGNDTLTGGVGQDFFVFNSSSQKTDTITDFSVVDDTVRISAGGFGGGLVAGAVIPAAQFRIGASATTANHRFIYDSTNGKLFFDVDGTGVTAQTHLATLSSGLAVTNNDIFVIA